MDSWAKMGLLQADNVLHHSGRRLNSLRGSSNAISQTGSSTVLPERSPAGGYMQSPSDDLSRAGQRSTALLVALDGFRPDYLDRPPSRHLRELMHAGVRARWMVPVFPSVTFPNFYSIATGLYPEHHGIISNNMKDSTLGRFGLRDTAAVHDPRWWGGEPIWVTAVKQGKRAATYFWPGSDVAIEGVRPTYYKVYDQRVPNADRVRQVLDWLSLPAEKAPALITVYFNDVDEAGHRFGPDAPETDSAIARVDSAVGAIMSGVNQGGLDGRVNLIVVSDHGMAGLSPSHLIYLDDFVIADQASPIDLGPVVSLIPRTGATDEVYARLSRAPHLKVYRRSEIPASYHYRSNPRIPPIVGVADEGWAVTTHAYVAAHGGELCGEFTDTRRTSIHAGHFPGSRTSFSGRRTGRAIPEHSRLRSCGAPPGPSPGSKRRIAGLSSGGHEELSLVPGRARAPHHDIARLCHHLFRLGLHLSRHSDRSGRGTAFSLCGAPVSGRWRSAFALVRQPRRRLTRPPAVDLHIAVGSDDLCL